MSYQRDSRNSSPKDEMKVFTNPLPGINDTPSSLKYQFDSSSNPSDARTTYSDILSSGTPSVSGRSTYNLTFDPNSGPTNNPFSKQRSSDTPSYSVSNYATSPDIFKDLDRALQKSMETRNTYTPSTSTQPLQTYKFTPTNNQSTVPDIENILKKSQDLRQLLELSAKTPYNLPPTTSSIPDRSRPEMTIDVNAANSNYNDYTKGIENYLSPTNSIPSSTSSKSGDADGKVKKVITKYHLNLQPIEETGESAILSPHDSKIFEEFTPKGFGEEEMKRSDGNSPPDSMRKSDGFNKPPSSFPEQTTPPNEEKVTPSISKSSSLGSLNNNPNNLKLSDYFTPNSALGRPTDLMSNYLSPQAVNILSSPSLNNFSSGNSTNNYEPMRPNPRIEDLINKYLSNESNKSSSMAKSNSNPNFFPTYTTPYSAPITPATTKVEKPETNTTDFFAKNKPVSYSSSLATSPEPRFLPPVNQNLRPGGYVNQQAYVNPFASDSTIINPSLTIKPTPTPTLNPRQETPSHKRDNSSQFYSFDDGSHVSFFSIAASEIKPTPSEYKSNKTEDQKNPYSDYDTLFDALDFNKPQPKPEVPSKVQSQPQTQTQPQVQTKSQPMAQPQPQIANDDRILKYLDPPDDLRGLKTVKLKSKSSDPSENGSNTKNRNLNQKYYTIKQTFNAEGLEDDYDSPTQSRPQTRSGMFPNELFEQYSLELENDYDSLIQSKRSAFEPPKQNGFDIIKEVPQAYESTPSKYGGSRMEGNKNKTLEAQMSPIHNPDLNSDGKGGLSMDRKTVSSDIFYDAEEKMYSFDEDTQKGYKLPQLLNKLDENSEIVTNRKSMPDKGRASLGYQNANEKTIDIFDFDNERYFTVDEINPELLESENKKAAPVPEKPSCMIWDIIVLNKKLDATSEVSKELSETIANAKKVKLISHCFVKFSNLKLQFK